MTTPSPRQTGDASVVAPCLDSPELAEGVPSNGYEALGLELLLYELQSPINIGTILRMAEVYRFKVSIVDRHGVFDDAGKLSTVSDFACGAISRRPPNLLKDPSALLRLRGGRRLVATSIGRRTSPLTTFHFLAGDLIVLGNEYDGLPDSIVAGADALLHVPTPAAWLPKARSHSPIDPARLAPVARDGQPSLNVAMTAGVLCYAAYAEWLAKQGAQQVAPATVDH